jgi:hypothetical protein
MFSKIIPRIYEDSRFAKRQAAQRKDLVQWKIISDKAIRVV